MRLEGITLRVIANLILIGLRSPVARMLVVIVRHEHSLDVTESLLESQRRCVLFVHVNIDAILEICRSKVWGCS